MASPHSEPAPLTAHPSTPSDIVHRLAVSVQAERPGILRLDYSLEADLDRVRLPSSTRASSTWERGGRTDGLWKHTCFEAFVASDADPGYLELNFAPSLDWALYVFSAYREGMRPADVGRPPEIAVHRDQNHLVLKAATHLEGLMLEATRLRLALSAVIEDENGRLSYWALRHSSDKPDFHHPDTFALELEL